MKQNLRLSPIILFILALSWPFLSFAKSDPNALYSKREAKKLITQFKANMVNKHKFEKDYLDILFKDFKPDKSILELVSNPAETALSWKDYRARFVNEQRIRKGLVFLSKHCSALKKTEQRYNIPKELLISIMGVETYYGRQKGSYSVVNALGTLAFFYKRRSEFFTKELEQLLILGRDYGIDITTLKGSYAGAMGYPQFMPSSYIAYAQAHSAKSAFPDIWESPVDAAESIASYIKNHNWRPNEPIMAKIVSNNNKTQSFTKQFKTELKPWMTQSELSSEGWSIVGDASDDMKLSPFEFEYDEHIIQRAGFHNFYVISRYNPRLFYTTAVFELYERILFNAEKNNICVTS